MAGMLSGCGSERHSQVSRAAFRSTVDGKATDLYTLRNARGLEMTVTNFGGRVVELWVPDRDGNFADIVLGHDNLGAYVGNHRHALQHHRFRSEERRVGKECRSRWSPYH